MQAPHRVGLLDAAKAASYTLLMVAADVGRPVHALCGCSTLAGGAELRSLRRPPPREVFVENFHRRQAGHRTHVRRL